LVEAGRNFDGPLGNWTARNGDVPGMRLMGPGIFRRATMAGHRFTKQVRLLRSREFERVFAARSSASDPWIAVFGAVNELGYPRLGLTVSRRIGKAAARNRWKRLLREAFRLTQHKLPALDLVCLTRCSTPPELRQLMESLPAMAMRIERRLARDVPRPAGDGP
jgi:ribonuclease P protein component